MKSNSLVVVHCDGTVAIIRCISSRHYPLENCWPSVPASEKKTLGKKILLLEMGNEKKILLLEMGKKTLLLEDLIMCGL